MTGAMPAGAGSRQRRATGSAEHRCAKWLLAVGQRWQQVTQAQAAESLTNSQLAELPASSGQGQITADIVNGLIADALAQPLNRSQSLVLVTDVVGDQIVTYYLKRIVPVPDSWEREWGSWGGSIEMPYYVITAQGTRPLSQQELRSYANIEAILADHRSGAAFALRASHFEGIVAAERRSEIATGGTFVLHLIPLGGAADYATQGNLKDAAISLAGDAAWLLGGPLAKAAHRSAKAGSLGAAGHGLVASAAIQTSIGVYSVGEGVYAIYRGDHFGATGYFGDAVLRLFGATASFKNAATATAKARAAASKGLVPNGFVSADEFANFGSAITRNMRAAGFDDVKAVLQGSGVTGVRAMSKPGIPAGTPFDVLKASDFDVALVSPKLFAKAKDLGIPLREGKTRTGPLWPGNLRAMGLGDLTDDLLKTLYNHSDRPIRFMIFESMEAALKRGPSIGVPGT